MYSNKNLDSLCYKSLTTIFDIINQPFSLYYRFRKMQNSSFYKCVFISKVTKFKSKTLTKHCLTF